MADIFLSIANAEDDKSEILEDALRRLGYSVASARLMPAGCHGEDWIGAQIDAARCVVIAWTRAALTCPAVRADATRAVIDGKYIPVLLEHLPACERPAQFAVSGRLDLSDWAGAPGHDGWQRLHGLIRRYCAEPGVGTVGPATLR